MRTFWRTLSTFLVTVVVGGVAIGACIAALTPGAVELATAHHYTGDQVSELSELSEKSTVYWNDGVTELGEIGDASSIRETVTFSEVPEVVTNAVIAIEDRTFWENDGIDLGATFRAFMANVTSGRIEQGGSTITQQLVKNRLLTTDQNAARKVKEIQLALRINEKFSKQKILEEYLNTVYFGQNSYGIKAAAYRFFTTPVETWPFVRGKNMDELTIGEAALLAGVIQSPEFSNPFSYPDRATKRRADVLRAMVGEGYITQAESDAANSEPLPTIQPPAEIRATNFMAQEVQERLKFDPQYNLGATPEEREERVLKGGLKIITSFDQRMQTDAEWAVANRRGPSPQGPDWVSSLVSIEPSTGAVKAMVGGLDFAANQYNLATDGIGYQPGSTWKVIGLATALQMGFSPNDTVDGSGPCSLARFGPIEVNNAGDTIGGGTMSLAGAVSGSVNCAFIRLSTAVGQDNMINMAHQLGITQARPKVGENFLTLAIGTVEATPLEMATVMATVANGGVRMPTTFVQRIIAADGTVLFDATGREGVRVLDPSVAECVQRTLRAVVTGGTGTKAAVPGFEIYGKTGTTNDGADAWFLGATSQLATSVWSGNRLGRGQGRIGYGGDVSAPIFSAYMTDALAGQQPVPLPSGQPVCSRPGRFVNETGGRTEPPPPPVEEVVPATPAPTTPPTPTTSTPAPTTPTAAPAAAPAAAGKP